MTNRTKTTTTLRRRLTPVALIAGGALAATGCLVFGPVAAQDAVTLAGLITCSSGSPCASWQNKGSGTGIQATAIGDGMRGLTTGKGASGVYGESDAKSGGYGVHGANTYASGIGVYAAGGPGTALKAISSGFYGIYGSATNIAAYLTSPAGIGLDAQSTSGYGVTAGSQTGQAIYGDSNSGTTSAIEADSYGTAAGQYQADAAHFESSTGNGAVLSNGTYGHNGIDALTFDGGKFGAIVGGVNQGLIALTGSGKNGVPLEAGSAGGGNGAATGFFYVDGSGNVHYTGSLYSYALTRTGSNVTAYETKSTRASLEDSGTAQLVAGSAVVPLDATFAQSIDLSTPYRVFLTPNGDTRGLYVAQKTAAGFVVRETQGGRGSFSFDYRILATAVGRSGERMVAVTPAVEARAFPMLRPNATANSFTGLAPRPRVPTSP